MADQVRLRSKRQANKELQQVVSNPISIESKKKCLDTEDISAPLLKVCRFILNN